jgi:TPR repeat protein
MNEQATELFRAAFQHEPRIGAFEHARFLLSQSKQAEAAVVLRAGAAAGSGEARGLLGKLLRKKRIPEQTPDEAVNVLSSEAQISGHSGAYAAYQLGKLYLASNQDFEGVQFVKLFEQANRKGLAKATRKLAQCYENGWGCKQDLEKARTLRARADELAAAEAAGFAILHRTLSA